VTVENNRILRHLVKALKKLARLLISLFILVFISCATLEIRDYTINTGARAMTIAHLSDLHFHTQDARYENVAKKVVVLNPDVVLMTGDYYGNVSRRDLLEWFLKKFASIQRKAAILGNHEYLCNDNILVSWNIRYA
jgi:predicted MPP superfamily phosphohydrolase